jgi:hypothetical protein
MPPIFSTLMQKKRATNVLRKKFRETITFLGAKIEKNFFYKKWAIFVAA